MQVFVTVINVGIKINADVNVNNCLTKEYVTKLLFDNLPLNNTLKVHNMTVVIRPVLEEHGKLYPQVYLDECLYEF